MTDGKTRKFVIGLIRVFLFAFLGVFVPGVTGILAAPNWDAQKAGAVALLCAALAAGAKALADILTKGQAPLPFSGVLPRKIAP